MLEVCMIVACDKNFGIGYKNRLPWRLPEDLKRFRELTMGHTVIMGRKTFESLPKQLEGREMQVISNTLTTGELDGKSAKVFPSLRAALLENLTAGKDRVFIIGGAQIYQEAFDSVNRVYMTWVTEEAEIDTYLKGIDLSDWPYENDWGNVYPTHRYTTYYNPRFGRSIHE